VIDSKLASGHGMIALEAPRAAAERKSKDKSTVL
jgi:hypothetical protein